LVQLVLVKQQYSGNSCPVALLKKLITRLPTLTLSPTHLLYRPVLKAWLLKSQEKPMVPDPTRL